MSTSNYDLAVGDSPLLVSIPHLGTVLPDEFVGVYNAVGGTVADTDWHLDRLYDFVLERDATVLSATVSRFVIDLNRPSNGASLYPGQTTTGLCPLETFHGEPIYQIGREPNADEIQRRVERFWRPYHEQLAAQIARIKAKHGYVLLWEAHSINSELPRLFDGTLPDLNFGTFENKSAHPGVAAALSEVAERHQYSWVMNGRFKGGYITRHYGDPENGVHAVQLEMSQKIYMNEDAPFAYRDDLAMAVKPMLSQLVNTAVRAAKGAASMPKEQ